MKEEIKSKISDKVYPDELIRDLMDINDMVQNKKSELEQLKTREEVVNVTSKILRSYYDKGKNE
ncbi:hypothetical protein N9460_01015 [Flavobacteriaceae bacterium]|nr:hypothetical protein [Flavobacteriaceae bacterium]